MWSNPRARAAVDSGETDRGDVREEIVVGNACGGKPGSHASKAILLSHAWGWSHHQSLLSTGQHRELNNRLAHQTSDALNYRVEPHPGCPFKGLTL